MEIGLVSYTKSKRDRAVSPKDLYLESAFFRKAREYVEANHDAWFILSAKHHLLEPDGEPIEPYEETLSGAPVAKKREWAGTMFEQLRDEGLLVAGNRLVFHAGRDCYDELRLMLKGRRVRRDV